MKEDGTQRLGTRCKEHLFRGGTRSSTAEEEIPQQIWGPDGSSRVSLLAPASREKFDPPTHLHWVPIKKMFLFLGREGAPLMTHPPPFPAESKRRGGAQKMGGVAFAGLLGHLTFQILLLYSSGALRDRPVRSPGYS